MDFVKHARNANKIERLLSFLKKVSFSFLLAHFDLMGNRMSVKIQQCFKCLLSDFFSVGFYFCSFQIKRSLMIPRDLFCISKDIMRLKRNNWIMHLISLIHKCRKDPFATARKTPRTIR